MRNYAWIEPPGGTGQFVEITTDSNGFNDAVYLSSLIQWFRLNLGESPFWAQAGIPMQQTVVTQVFPDFYVARTQQYFSSFFAAINITRASNSSPPTYNAVVTTHSGSVIPFSLNVTAP